MDKSIPTIFHEMRFSKIYLLRANIWKIHYRASSTKVQLREELPGNLISNINIALRQSPWVNTRY